MNQPAAQNDLDASLATLAGYSEIRRQEEAASAQRNRILAGNEATLERNDELVALKRMILDGTVSVQGPNGEDAGMAEIHAINDLILYNNSRVLAASRMILEADQISGERLRAVESAIVRLARDRYAAVGDATSQDQRLP